MTGAELTDVKQFLWREEMRIKLNIPAAPETRRQILEVAKGLISEVEILREEAGGMIAHIQQLRTIIEEA